jgi:hypothetical protein
MTKQAMSRKVLLSSAAAAALIVPAIVGSVPAGAASISTYATGFQNPRGLKFGPDGLLYVAEGGTGGGNSTAGQCDQVVPPVGPYTGSATGGRISKVVNHARVTVTDRLPTSQTSANLGHLVSGVADIAWIGNTLYALVAGGGCSHGVASKPNGIYRVHSNGSVTLVADLQAWQHTHPVANPEPDDFEPDGTWYSMIAERGLFWAVEPNHGDFVRVSTNGDIERVADISASQGHIVPTAVAFHGNFYIGNLNTFPIQFGSSRILKVNPSGYVQRVASGLTTVLGVAFDANATMYVLENTVGQPGPTPGFGDIVRISPNGKKQTIVSGLALPTGITFGPDGALYVSNLGFGPPAGSPEGPGQVLRITGF